jgi:prepilin-type N-terminal cleavage/methylation domain-containing protein
MNMPRHNTRKRRGFTLIELSVAMMVGITIATLVMAIFNQQLAFLRLFRQQSFLNEEAPLVSLHVSRLIGKADRYRLHDTLEDALAGRNPRLTDCPVLVMNFRQPDGPMRATILSFEDRGTGPELYHYVVPVTGLLGAPQWSVTNKPTDVRFFMDQGVLRMRLTGPGGEQIIYSGTMQQ